MSYYGKIIIEDSHEAFLSQHGDLTGVWSPPNISGIL